MGRLGSSALVRQLDEKENSEFKPIKLRLKIDLVSHPVRAEGLVNMINQCGITNLFCQRNSVNDLEMALSMQYTRNIVSQRKTTLIYKNIISFFFLFLFFSTFITQNPRMIKVQRVENGWAARTGAEKRIFS